MRVTLDTNALVRIVVSDDPAQTELAQEIVARASLIALTMPCLCELVWVLRSVYGFDRPAMVTVIRALVEIQNLVLHRPALEAGLTFLESGGDFADGVIAAEGRMLGGETFVSFDKRAVTLVEKHGGMARLLQAPRS